MTCIAATVHDGTVWMGGDSAGVAGLDITVTTDPKVFKVGAFLIGSCGSVRMKQLLHYAFNPPTPKEGQDLMTYMVTEFIPGVQQCFEAGKWTSGDETDKGGFFLVGYRGRLFQIESDFQVSESANPYAALGCGAKYALGNFYATPTRTPRDRVLNALQAAEQHSAGVCGPFVILSAPL